MKRYQIHRTSRPVIAVAVLALAIILGGCSSARFVATAPEVSAAKPDDCSIEVYSSRVPDREYAELGVVEGEGSFGADTLAKVLPKMKTEACRAGGDAIILHQSQKSVEMEDFVREEQLNVTATVVAWVD